MGVTNMNAISFLQKKNKILKEQRKNDHNYDRNKRKAMKENKDKKYLHDLYTKYDENRFNLTYELMELLSRWYTYRSYNLQLPTYYGDDDIWVKGKSDDYILTNKGLTTLRSAIRNERHERFRGAFSWISIIIGLIGALTGLFAVIGK